MGWKKEQKKTREMLYRMRKADKIAESKPTSVFGKIVKEVRTATNEVKIKDLGKGK